MENQMNNPMPGTPPPSDLPETPSPPPAASESDLIPFGNPPAPPAAQIILRRADGSERVIDGLDVEALLSVQVKNPRILAAIDQVPDAFLAALEAAVLSGRWFGTLSWHSSPQPPDDLLHTWTTHRYDPRDVVTSLKQLARDFVTKQAAKLNREAEMPWS